MKRKKVIAVGIIVAAVVAGSIAVALVSLQGFNGSSSDKKPTWVVSGPFAIDKSEYILGENIFMSVNGLLPNEKGSIVFLRPGGFEYKVIPFNGAQKSEFNHYFTPSIFGGVCGPEDLAGTWKIVFDGAAYGSITFDIKYEFLPGSKDNYEPVC